MPEKRTCFFVIGPYRSGTSMISRVLLRLGLDPGPESELFPATAWNPGGYIQRPDITNLNSFFISRAGGNLSRPGSIEKITQSVDPKDFQSLGLGWASGKRDILIKDPRLSFTAMAWITHSPLRERYRFSFICVTRELNKVAKSALCHYDVKNYCGPTLESAKEVSLSYEKAARWHLYNAGVRGLIIKYEDLLDNPCLTISNLGRFVSCADRDKLRAGIESVSEGRSLINTEAAAQRPQGGDKYMKQSLVCHHERVS